MKKIVLAFALIGASFAASAADGANFGKIEYNFRDYDADTRNQSGGSIVLGREVAPGIKLDGKAEFRVTNGSDTISNRLEAGATYATPITGNLGVFVRGAIGEKFTNGDNYGYFSVEPGVTYALNKNWAVSGSYRYRDAFNDGKAGAETHRAQIGAAYALTQNTVLTASVGRSLGDVQYNAFNVGYGFKF